MLGPRFARPTVRHPGSGRFPATSVEGLGEEFYTGVVSGRSKLAWWVLFCLPAAMHARDFKIHVPGSVGMAAWEVSGSIRGILRPGESVSVRDAGWDVTIAFDAEECELFCSYRRVADPLGRTPLTDLLLPPVTAIRVDTWAFVVNPGGCEIG